MKKSLAATAVLAAFLSVAQADPIPVAAYQFNNGSLASSIAGAPSLVAVDPQGTSGFGTATVNGATTNVYNFVGNTAPAQQAGLSLNVSSLISNAAVYSVDIQFSFVGSSGWRRILDVDSRLSDNGFYVDPGSNLDIYPVAGGAAFTNNTFHDVVLSVNNGTVNFYLDGGPATTIATHVMDLDGSGTMNFFLDNIQAGGQGEYSSGSVASIAIYNQAVSTGTLPGIPPVPEPETYALMLAGLGAVGFMAKRRQRRG